jgi:hypothetical protein
MRSSFSSHLLLAGMTQSFNYINDDYSCACSQATATQAADEL